MTSSVLVVDDDQDIRTVVRVALEKAGMQVYEAPGASLAIEHIRQCNVDLVVLDIGMPEMDGFACCRAIRAMSNVPILFLTAQDDEIDRVLGFELGADDYVSKPFSPRELILRIKAILGRGRPNADTSRQRGDLLMSLERHLCMLGTIELELTATEFTLLWALLAHPGFVFQRNTLINDIYGKNTNLSGRTIDSHIRHIRAKAAEIGCIDLIQSVRGIGIKIGSCHLVELR